jgi:hypothetical protein
MDSTAQERLDRPVYRSLRSRALLVGIVGVSGLVAGPAVAQAASRGGTSQGREVLGRAARPLSPSVCSKVSAASVSSIIGYSVPAGTAYTINIKPTTANFETSAVETTCTYGAETSIAALKKDVTLSFEVLSKPLTTSEIQQSIAKASSASLKLKFTSYSGLGVPAFYFSLTAAGITGQGITVVPSGTRYFGASVETKNLSMSKLAKLAKLAEQL